MTKLKAFWSDRRGATSIEYAMIAAGISIVIVGSVTAIGTKLSVLYIGKVVNGLN